MIGLTFPINGKSAGFANNHTIAILSAWLKKNRPGETVFFSQSLADLIACDEVWCTSTSESFGEVNAIGKVITEAGKKFIVGGHHSTNCPESLEFGSVFMGRLHGTESLVPDWDICADPTKQYVSMSSFGCPFRCSFCSSSHFWGGHIYKPVDVFVAEIEALKARSIRYVNIFDDLFVFDRKRLRRIAERIGPLDMEFGCLIRADVVTEEKLTLLQNMGVKNIAFGAESGSNRVLSLMNKSTTAEMNQRAADMISDGRFGAVCSLIAGYPGETVEDLDMTVEFVRRNRDKMLVKVYPCVPFPGTKLWTTFVAMHNIDTRAFDWSRLRLDDVDWDKYPMMVEYERRRLVDVVDRTKEI
ncbi:MAG: radical SAM protein [Acidobacteria bacterium]|nr:radical SAM protein [Acidobacteriota bacterium]